MKLRSNINPPQWYQSESEYVATDHRRLSRSAAARRKTKTKNYVEYDPHLPPAVFPTLDQPLPAGHAPPPPPPSKEAGGPDADLDPFPHIPSESLDNFIASNGPQNPQYVRNMALLDKEPSSDIEISSDEDVGGDDNAVQSSGSAAIGDRYHGGEQELPENPQWHELSLALQIEIAENMLEVHDDLQKIRALLGLNQCDIEELARHLHKRNGDIEHENRVLEEMQNKQLKALMCLDNSDLRKHSVPARLIMSKKSWNQCHRAVQKKSRMRHLLCQAGDLQIARRFLSRRGLSMTYAGEWDNQFVANPSVSDLEGVPEAFQWRLATNSLTNSETVAGDNNNEGLSESSTDEQIAVEDTQAINNTDTATSFLPQMVQENGHSPLPSPRRGVQDGYSQVELPRQSLVRLKIGAKNAAHIQAVQPPPASRRYLTDMPTRSLSHPRVREPDSDDTIEQSPPKPHRSVPIQGHFQLPVRRKLGCWSADISRPQTPRLVLPPITESRESPGGIGYGLSITDQWTYQNRGISDIISEQIYEGCVMENMSAFDRTPQSPGLTLSEDDTEASPSGVVTEHRSIGAESEQAIITHNIPRDVSGSSINQLQQNPMHETNSPSTPKDENEAKEIPQTTDPVPACQTNPSEHQEQPVNGDINESDVKESAVIEESKEVTTSSPIPAHDSNEPDASQVGAENQSNPTVRKRGRPPKKRTVSNPSPATQPKRIKKSSETFVTQRVLRDRSGTKKESKK